MDLHVLFNPIQDLWIAHIHVNEGPVLAIATEFVASPRDDSGEHFFAVQSSTSVTLRKETEV
jgi:hypothetical protein